MGVFDSNSLTPLAVGFEVVKTTIAEIIVANFKRIASLIGTGEGKNVHGLATAVSIFPGHRRSVSKLLYEAAFKTGEEVFYVTIMSKHSLYGMSARLQRAQSSHTTLKVLTWSPKVDGAVLKAFGKHLDEESSTRQQVKEAALKWMDLAREYPAVITEAPRCYSSTPTMQDVVVKDDWALIELLPYHTAPDDRPAIFLSASLETELFGLFQDAFRNLWGDSAPL